MNIIGIDVSRGNSHAALITDDFERMDFSFSHNRSDFRKLAAYCLYHWALSGQRNKVKLYFETRFSDSSLTPTQIEALNQAKTYILGNWQAILNTQEPAYQRCSAEGHISHYLSKRLSSRPLGWSKIGAESVARSIIFQLNGGNIAQYLLEKQRKAAKERRIKQTDRRFKAKNLAYYEQLQADKNH